MALIDAVNSNLNLKTPYVMRIFLSSPFNGMEGERETLTRLNWPRLETWLSYYGITLRIVDLRWGITSESSSDSQTLSICLQEIDRSDLFIGFFGQRYGWHGVDDEALQADFDKAQDKYPWINNYRDRSVTELEFLGGHLNNPGALPSIIGFRDKKYDDEHRAEGEKEGDKKKVSKYSAESEASIVAMDDLKRRVQESEDKTLGITMSYQTHEEFAEFVSSRITDYLSKKLPPIDRASLTPRLKAKFISLSYMTSLSSIYIGGDDYMKELDDLCLPKENPDDCKLLVVYGGTGTGKSALISNWARKFVLKPVENLKYTYHFIGSDSTNINPVNLMMEIVEEVHISVLNKEYTRPTWRDANLMKHELITCLSKVEEDHPEITLIIIIDAIEQLVYKDKSTKNLFWLPRSVPKNVRLILSLCTATHFGEETSKILEDEFKPVPLHIQPLCCKDKQTLILEILQANSKGLSNEQMNLLLESKKTTLPQYTSLLVHELCAVGKFRQLTDQIIAYLGTDGLAGLLEMILDRMEIDYDSPDYDGNVVKDFLACISICKEGLTEEEMPFAVKLWTPIYFALHKTLMVRNGAIGFNSLAMPLALQTRYFGDDQYRKRIYEMVIKIFNDQLQEARTARVKLADRCVTELSHLLYFSGDTRRLAKLLSDIFAFEVLYSNDSFLLYEYWMATGLDSDCIARRYLRSIDKEISQRYTLNIEEYEEDNMSQEDINWEGEKLTTLHQFFNTCKMFDGDKVILQKNVIFQQRRKDGTLVARERRLASAKYSLACLLCQREELNAAIELHNNVLKVRQRLEEIGKIDNNELGSSYHGLGTCYQELEDYDNAEMHFEKAYELQKDGKNYDLLATTLCNLGMVQAHQGKLEDALNAYMQSIKIREENEINYISLDMAYLYHNLALIYRKMERYDGAEENYKKSLLLKEKLLGRHSIDVAFTLMNLGTLESIRENFEAALAYSTESMTITRAVAPDSSQRLMAEENTALAYVTLSRFEEAEPIYLTVYNELMKNGNRLAKGLPSLHREMVNYYARNDNWEKAGEITVNLIECGRGNARDYGLLEIIDSNLTERPHRPDHLSIDAGLKRFPEDGILIKAKLKHLDEREKIMGFVKSHCESQSESEVRGRRHLVTAGNLAYQFNRIPESLEVLEECRTYAPNNEDLEDLTKAIKGLLEGPDTH